MIQYSESMINSLEQMRGEIEGNFRSMGSEMKEMKLRLDTLMASVEEKKDKGRSQ